MTRFRKVKLEQIKFKCIATFSTNTKHRKHKVKYNTKGWSKTLKPNLDEEESKQKVT